MCILIKELVTIFIHLKANFKHNLLFLEAMSRWCNAVNIILPHDNSVIYSQVAHEAIYYIAAGNEHRARLIARYIYKGQQLLIINVVACYGDISILF